MPETKKAYKCRCSLYRKKKHYRPGDIVHLIDEEATQFVEDKVLIPCPEPEVSDDNDLFEIFKQLEPEQFTAAGPPKVKDASELAGRTLTSDELAAAWAKFKALEEGE